MGLSFKKELVLYEHSIRRDNLKYWSVLQEKLVAKFGKTAYPFHLEFPNHCSPSVTIVPESPDSREPCGVEYFIRVKHNSLEKKLSLVNLTIRKIQLAPKNIERSKEPVTLARKDFALSPGHLELEASLDNYVYFHGDDVNIYVNVRNNSTKTIKRISALVLQNVDVAMFKGIHFYFKDTKHLFAYGGGRQILEETESDGDYLDFPYIRSINLPTFLR